MSTTFKNGVIVKDGKNMGVKTPPTGTGSAGQNVSGGNAPEWLTGAVDKGKDIAQNIYDGFSGGAENFMSNIRSKNLNKAPDELGSESGQAYWGQSEIEDRDWRVKLSLPENFKSSELIEPLKATGGMMFPYTPTIILSHTANYNQIAPIHNNYPFFAYQNSQVDQLVITGQFYSQNSIEASYWVGCLHYLRSVTKMNYGQDKANKGQPPPIVRLNGYGDYVFKDVPVLITNFTVDMPNEVDYIATGFDVDLSDQGASIANQKRQMTVGWAPSESQFTVTVQPVYSRSKVNKFNYQDFINGSNLDGGYI
tara:strand:+ start:3487 stop:4413 length:927 start_codon:yes stop_codon:yes gene_type:complete